MKRLLLDAARRWVVFSLGLGLGASALQAAEGDHMPVTYFGKTHILNSSISLPARHFRGAGEVIIAPEAGQTCVLDLADQTFVDSVKFIVHKGGQLRVRGSLLRQCHFRLEEGADVSLDSCALDRCEFSGNSALTNNLPVFRVINCILYGGAWMVPINCVGLEMMDSVVMGQRSEQHLLRLQTTRPLVEYARRPSIRHSRFEDCLIHPTLLLTVTQVTIQKCKGLFSSSEVLVGRGGNSPKTLLPVRWEENQPVELPATIGDGVGITRITDPIAGGCTLTGKIEDGALGMDRVIVTQPMPIQEMLPVSADKVAAEPVAPPTQMPAESLASLPLRQTHVNGLLVMPLSSGKSAGQVSRMNMTVVPGTSVLRFSQKVGSDMSTALNEVQKFVRLRHTSLPAGIDLEIAFEEKYSGKDGPSAAVACALLAESLITGKTWDPAFAVTGDMNADGAVQPIGGVSAKVRGATRGTCKVVAIPVQNVKAVSDILVQDGPAPLVGIHIFALEHFDQAVSLASLKERPALLQQAIDEFEIIRTALQRDPRQMLPILRTPQAITRLQAVLQKAPNSVSAKYLLMVAQGQVPAALSLSGSIEAADSNAMALVNSIENDVQGTISILGQDEVGGALNRLRNLRPKLDQRVWSYVDALVNYGEVLRAAILNPVKSRSRYEDLLDKARQAAQVINSTKSRLLSDPQVREDLGL